MSNSGLFPTKKLAGWGNVPQYDCPVKRPESVVALREHIDTSTISLGRGLGRSYGDAALQPDGYTLLLERLNRFLEFDDRTGILKCEGGVSFDDILRTFVPRGWFLPVTPGTKFITVGGAIAHDIHGKNHHSVGSFSNYLLEITLLTASGQLLTCSRNENAPIFWATISGLGLTGIILEATFSLIRIGTAFIEQTSIKTKDLSETLTLFDQYEADFPYAVAWIDCLKSGNKLGRSHVLWGKHATQQALPSMHQYPFSIHHQPRFSIPFYFPRFVLNRATMKMFNALYYHKQAGRTKTQLVHYDPYFYPLDFINSWNKMYGKAGFVQFQCVLPNSSGSKGLKEILACVQKMGNASFLAVLKKFGEEKSQAFLSFPMKGYTLAMDFPYHADTPKLLAKLHEIVLQYSGRIYLAKDAYLSPDSFRSMYQNYPEWLAVKNSIDPNNQFRSALGERLNIGNP